MKNNNFWKKKNVLITGISGFVGSNLAKNLSNIGANVVGLTQKKRKKLQSRNTEFFLLFFHNF